MCNDTMVTNVNNWKELTMNRKAWNDLLRKPKPTRGCRVKGRRSRNVCVYVCIILGKKNFTFLSLYYEVLRSAVNNSWL